MSTHLRSVDGIKIPLTALAALATIPVPAQVGELLVPALEKALAWHGRPLLKLPEFAALVGVHDNTATKWARTGQIPTVRVGGLDYVPTQQFLRWLDEATNFPPLPKTRRHARPSRPLL